MQQNSIEALQWEWQHKSLDILRPTKGTVNVWHAWTALATLWKHKAVLLICPQVDPSIWLTARRTVVLLLCHSAVVHHVNIVFCTCTFSLTKNCIGFEKQSHIVHKSMNCNAFPFGAMHCYSLPLWENTHIKSVSVQGIELVWQRACQSSQTPIPASGEQS